MMSAGLDKSGAADEVETYFSLLRAKTTTSRRCLYIILAAALFVAATANAMRSLGASRRRGEDPRPRRQPLAVRLWRAGKASAQKGLVHVVVPYANLTVAELVIVAAYFATMAALLWSNVPQSPTELPFRLVAWSSRAGALAVASVPFNVLLTTQNGVLSALTGIDYVRLQFLHRWSSRATLLLALLHGGAKLWSVEGVVPPGFMRFGVAAFAVACALLLVAHRLSMRAAYEVFWAVHLVLAAALIGLVWRHQSRHAAPLIAALAIWAASRLLRLSRMLRWTGLFGGSRRVALQAHLVPLPGDVVRVEVALPEFAPDWCAGSYAYIWVAGSSLLPQFHPFTIASTPGSSRSGALLASARPTHAQAPAGAVAGASKADDDVATRPEVSPRALAFVVKARQGWTRRLVEAANDDARRVRLAVDGPYGGMPRVAGRFDTIVLCAGGVGASWTFSALLSLVAQANRGVRVSRKLHFVWVIRFTAHLSWFPELALALATAPPDWMFVHLFITTGFEPDEVPASLRTFLVPATTPREARPAQAVPSRPYPPEAWRTPPAPTATHSPEVVVGTGRPEWAVLLSQLLTLPPDTTAVASQGAHLGGDAASPPKKGSSPAPPPPRAFVGASGPRWFSDSVRRTVRRLLSPSSILRGHTVELDSDEDDAAVALGQPRRHRMGDIDLHVENFGW